MKLPFISFTSTCALAIAAACTACHSPSQYVSPRVEGRVLDEQTQQPIKGVDVRRTSDRPRPMDSPKGGEMLMQAPAVVTDADGGFIVRSVRYLAFIRRMPSQSVTLSFTHPGYEKLRKTYLSTNTSPDEPMVQAGDIALKQLSK